MKSLVVALFVLSGGANSGEDDATRLKSFQVYNQFRNAWKHYGYTALLDTVDRPVNPVAERAYARFQEQHPLPWQVEWSQRTGCVQSLDGPGYKLGQGSFEEQATNFIQQNIDMFIVRDSSDRHPAPEFRLKDKDPYAGPAFRFAHYSQGIPVYQSGITVSFGPNGTLHRVNSSLWLVGRANTTPALQPAEAATAVKNRKLEPELERLKHLWRVPDNPGLVIFPSSPPRLMYLVDVWNGPLYLVDAHTGEVLLVTTRISSEASVDPKVSPDSSGGGAWSPK